MFSDLPPVLAEALAARGYATPTSVQSAVLAPETVGRDLVVSAKTGSGKTVAFGLAAAPEIMAAQKGKPSTLVVAPTRELALQVQRELSWLYAKAGRHVVSCVGGMDPRREGQELARGCDIVVGTPGRLCDHLDRGRLDLESVRVLILDEADEMLDLGFRDELEHILLATPKERRTLLFSATVPPAIQQIAARYQKDALRIAVAAGEAHSDIEYRAVMTIPREREHAVVNILRFIDAPGALVFCHTRDGVNHLHGNLVERGFSAVVLSGELGQAERNRALAALRDGRARVCVATDVAARGIDLPDLGLVIHADMPREASTLLHRSGRTGRAGRKGIAAVIVPANRGRAAERLFHEAGVTPRWIGAPPAEQVRERDGQRLLEGIRAECVEVDEADRTIAKLLLEGADAEALVSALVKIRRGAMPEPEEVTPWNAPYVAPRQPKFPPANAPEQGVSHRPPLAPAPFPPAPRPQAVATPSAGQDRPVRSVPPASAPPQLSDAPVFPAAAAPIVKPKAKPAPPPVASYSTPVAGLPPAVSPIGDGLTSRERRAALRAASKAKVEGGYIATPDTNSPPPVTVATPAGAGPHRTVVSGDSAAPAKPQGGDSPPVRQPKAKKSARNEELPPVQVVSSGSPVRRPPAPRANAAPEGVWFKVNVGLHQRADPKWLLPMLCRRGNIEKEHIGGFRVFAHETRVLIRADIAGAFFERASRPDNKDPRVIIVPADR